ncbi:hypothetical protein T8T21_05805 [Limimaricola variabilis]|uniref:DEAD/DEAH box helicase family protein n=1 Tax=Limimaricola variabilis TaxID=1492771 RepID=UPI002AC8C67D|nr:DEAD/DEAH box helicase family protein [Limimaricola variabilis]WPY95633.1 hypothetical protein T8T21_05805 [Limimaricola variabilis]
MDQLTILRSDVTAAKRVRLKAGGQLKVDSGQFGSRFDVEQVAVECLESLYQQLCRLQSDPNKFVIRGALAEDRPTTGVKRTSRQNGTEPANFIACPRQWLMIDLDGIPLPEEWIDLENHTVDILDYVISLLPPEFSGAACAYQWSGSMGFKTGEIRLHLWFWLERAVSDQEAKAWLQNSPVDLLVFGAVQPHFTAAPVLDAGVEDPLIERLGLYHPPGCRAAVQPPADLPERALRPRFRLHRSASGTLDTQGIVRDPDTGLVIDGRERFMLLKSNDATCELLRGQKARKTAPGVREIADLTWRLFSHEADLTDGKWSYDNALSEAQRRHEELLSGSYSFTSRNEATVLLPASEPFTTLSTVDADTGKEQLNSALTDFFSQLHDKPRLALRITTGAGKTHATLSNLRDYLASSWGQTVEIYVPRHDLAEQYVEEINELGGFQAEVIHVGPRTGGSAGAMPILCERPEYVRGLEQARLSVFGNACATEDGTKCKFFESCRYLQQFRDVEASSDNHGNVVRIMVHQYLRMPRNYLMSRPDLVVIDEAFFQEVVDTNVKIPLRDIRQHVRTEDIPDLGRKIAIYLEDGEPLLRCLRNDGVTASDLGRVGLSHLQPALAFDPDRLAKPAMNGDAILYRSLTTMLRLLQEEMRLHPCRDDASRVVCDASGSEGPVVRLAFTQGPVVTDDTAVLCLDATADQTLLEPLLGPIDLVRIDVKQNALITQVYDRTGSKAYWSDNPEAVGQLERVLNAWSEFGEPPLVVGHKELADRLRGSENVDPSVRVGHFSALRGSNDAKGCSTIFVTGRNMPSAAEVDLKARALFWDDEEPLLHDDAAAAGRSDRPTRLPVQLRGYVQSSLNPLPQSGVKVPSFSDQRIEAVHAQIRDAETMQAIGRLRLVHSPYRKRVFLLSNLPVEVPVDQLVSFDELMPDRLELELLKKGNIPLTPLGLLKMRPDLAPSKAVAEKLLQRSRVREVSRLKSIPELIRTGAVILTFKAKNAGRTREHQHLFLLDWHTGYREPGLSHGMISVGHFSLERAVRLLVNGDPEIEGSGWAGVSDPHVEEVFREEAP